MADEYDEIELIVSLDEDDPTLPDYFNVYDRTYDNIKHSHTKIISKNKSAVDAINNAAKVATGNVFIVVSDDTDCMIDWNLLIDNHTHDKTDWILKTQDSIQPWIITNPILDRAYYNRTGYIYDHDFRHMFCDTWLTVQADISGRKLTSNLMFKHLNDTIKDDVRKRSDATWDEGQRTFIQKLKQTPIEDLRKITDQSMKNWIRNYAGIRL